jgi:hypothetical protein
VFFYIQIFQVFVIAATTEGHVFPGRDGDMADEGLAWRTTEWLSQGSHLLNIFFLKFAKGRTRPERSCDTVWTKASDLASAKTSIYFIFGFLG